MNDPYEDGDPNAPPEPDPVFHHPIRRVFIDANILFTQPDVVLRPVSGVELVAVEHVFDMIRRHSTSQGPARQALAVLEEAERQGIVVREPLNNSGKLPLGRLPMEDAALLRHVYPQKEFAVIATNDLKIVAIARQLGIRAWTGAELQSWLKLVSGTANAAVARKIGAYEGQIVLWGVVGAALLMGVSFLIALHGNAPVIWLLDNMGLVAWIVPPLGMMLFICKARQPLAYGLVEVLVGTLGTWMAAIALGDKPSYGLGLTIITGLYVVVRGTESVKRGAKSGWLHRFFAIMAGPEPSDRGM